MGKYSMDDLFENIKKCQRNWNFNKPVKEKHIEEFINVAHNAPKKNMISHFSLIALSDRDAIKDFASSSLPEAMQKNKVDDSVIQPQMFAPFVMGWVEDWDIIEAYKNNAKYPMNLQMSAIHIGMSATLVALKAQQYGYKTGFCACFTNSNKILEKYDVRGEVKLFLGIGKPLHTASYYRHLGPKIIDGELHTTQVVRPRDEVKSSEERNNYFFQLPPKTLRV